MRLRELKNQLKDKKILILGFGREGRDSYLALRRLFPEKELAIADESDRIQLSEAKPQIIKHLGRNYLKAIKDYDLIIKSPGIPLSKIKPFLNKKGAEGASLLPLVISQTEIFFDNFKGTIIGVTGTKGKGTVASLIYRILKAAGLKTHLVGNIGKPVFQLLVRTLQTDSNPVAACGSGQIANNSRVIDDKAIVVYELSSHQLQGLKKSPHIAVFLNLFPDHLDYYRNLTEYQRAKENITKWQGIGDYLVYNADDQKVKAIAKKSRAKKIPVSLKTKLTDFERSLKECYRLKGGFNFFNLRAAVETAKILNVPEKAIKQAVKSFKGLPERLEYIGRFKGIEFYSDSMSTLPEVTAAALQALGPVRGETSNGVKTLMVGGSDKGSDYVKLAETILRQKIQTLILLGKGTGQQIERIIKKKKKASSEINIVQADSMKQAVKIAFQESAKGDICLLSPGAASFNLFQDYQARGQAFKKWVKHYGKG